MIEVACGWWLSEVDLGVLMALLEPGDPKTLARGQTSSDMGGGECPWFITDNGK